jgi:hypothetical protein
MNRGRGIESFFSPNMRQQLTLSATIYVNISVTHSHMSSVTIFLGYLRVTMKITKVFLILTIDVYHIINKLIILVSDPH